MVNPQKQKEQKRALPNDDVELLDLINTKTNPKINKLLHMVQTHLKAPVVAVGIVQPHMICFGSRLGLEEDTMERAGTFCDLTVAEEKPLYIKDTTKDSRSCQSPLVLEAGLKTYAGVPLRKTDGSIMATLCIAAFKPRTYSKSDQTFAEYAGSLIEAEMLKSSSPELAFNSEFSYLNTLSNTIGDSVIVVDAQGNIANANPATECVFGYSITELLEQNAELLIAEHLIDSYRENLAECNSSSFPYSKPRVFRFECKRKNDERFSAEITFSKMKISGADFFVAVARDIGKALTQKKLLDSVLNNLPHLVTAKDPETLAYVFANQAFLSFRDKSKQEVIGKKDEDIFPKEEAKSRAEQDQIAIKKKSDLVILGNKQRDSQSEARLFYTRKICVRGNLDNPKLLVDISEDVSEKLKTQEKIYKQATEDTLTGAYNRAALWEKTLHEINVSDRYGYRFGLLYLDLNKFKAVNDKYGHYAGDRVLIESTNRLRNLVRNVDIIARIGGDEFIVVIKNVNSDDEVLNLIERVKQTIITPIDLDTVQASIGVSIGYSIYPEHGQSIEDLIKHADSMMYQDKTALPISNVSTSKE